MTAPQSSIRAQLKDILDLREYEIPKGQGFEGTGAPGLYLEHLLKLKTSNLDIPDAGAWEVKFTSGSALLTLFHKTANRDGPTIRDIIEKWGYIGRNGRPNFRYTVCGQTSDYEVRDEEGFIRVRRGNDDSFVPFWSHDALITAFARKLGNLIHVQGSWSKRPRLVTYDSAEFLSGARITQLINFIVNGTICIDFDAYLRENGSVRDHGTKFRIRPGDLQSLYTTREEVR